MNQRDELIVELYRDGGSARQVGETVGVSHQTVIRVVKKYGVHRDKSAAQKTALEQGTAQHPTEGTKLSEETKRKISEGISAAWRNSSEEELQKRADDARDRWNDLPQHKRDELIKASQDAVRLAAKDGSKLEKYVHKGLTKADFVVEYHKENLIPNPQLQVDIYLPRLGIAIEIDGPSHFLPIWGHEKLQKNIRADLEKMGILFKYGIKVIRIKQMTKTVSQKVKRDALTAVLECIEEIKDSKDRRLIEREV